MTIAVKFPRKKPTPLDETTPEIFLSDMKRLLKANPEATNPQWSGNCVYEAGTSPDDDTVHLETEVSNCAIGGMIAWMGMLPFSGEDEEASSELRWIGERLEIEIDHNLLLLADNIQNLADGGAHHILSIPRHPDDPRPWGEVLELIEKHEDHLLGKKKEVEEDDDA